MLSQVHLRSLFDYDPDTGVIRWKYVENPTTSAERFRNSKFAGKIAGTPHKATGGISIRVEGESILAHHLAWFLMTGDRLNCVQHANGDATDNRWSNLRAGDRAEASRHSAEKTGSAFRGVVFRGWEAKVTDRGTTRRAGYFPTEIEAARAYDAKARELFGETAKLNFPDDPGDHP